MWLEIDVQPFGATIAREVLRASNELATNTGVLMGAPDSGVENKRVFVSIPSDVDEAHEFFAIPASDIAKASAQDLPESTRLVTVPRVGEQIDLDWYRPGCFAL